MIDNTDLTNPHLSHVYYTSLTHYAFDVYVSGDYAYVASGEAGLAVVDISNPVYPIVVNYSDTDGTARDICIDGNYAFIADGNMGFSVIDITDPTHPDKINYTLTTDFAYGLYISGDYAYIADGVAGLTIIDISNPSNPYLECSASTYGSAEGVFISGDYAYVADGGSGLSVVNITHPTHPTVINSIDTNGYAEGVHISGDYAYVACGEAGLAVFDISNPIYPVVVNYSDTNGIAKDVCIDGNYAYIADDSAGIAFIDISNPLNPSSPKYMSTSGYAYGLYIDGTHVFIADYDYGLAVADIAIDINPRLNYVPTQFTNEGLDVFVSGDYAYLVGQYGGLNIHDVSDPKSEGSITKIDVFGQCRGVWVDGDYAYIATNLGLAAVNITDPTDASPKIYYYEDVFFEDFNDVFVKGDFAYIASISNGLVIVNISDPTNIETAFSRTISGECNGIYVEGNYAYIACGGAGLAVVNVSDPTNPGTPEYRDTGGYVNDVFISGDNAFLACGGAGLAVVDVFNISNLGTPVYAENDNWIAEGVYVSGDRAYIANDDWGLAVVDITNTTNPIVVSNQATVDAAFEIYVSGDFVYLASGTLFGHNALKTLEVRRRYDFERPELLSVPNDLIVDESYSGIYFSWTATDSNPRDYTIDLLGFDTVVPSTSWWGYIRYDIPIGLPMGTYTYKINLTDWNGNYATDFVNLTVTDLRNPELLVEPTDLIVDESYSGMNFSWITTDNHPLNYTIELLGFDTVVPSSSWSSGTPVVYTIPEDLPMGTYTYVIIFTDQYENSIIDVVNLTITDIKNPILTIDANDLIVYDDYTRLNFTWMATDDHPLNYTIELLGVGIEVESTSWSSGTPIVYSVPEDLPIGTYTYVITFTDQYGNFISDTVTLTINPIVDDTNANPAVVSFGYNYLIFIGFGLIISIFLLKRKISNFKY